MKVNKANHAAVADNAKEAERASYARFLGDYGNSLSVEEIVLIREEFFLQREELERNRERIQQLEVVQEMLLEFLDLELSEVPARAELMKKKTDKKLGQKAGVVKTNPFLSGEAQVLGE